MNYLFILETALSHFISYKRAKLSEKCCDSGKVDCAETHYRNNTVQKMNSFRCVPGSWGIWGQMTTSQIAMIFRTILSIFVPNFLHSSLALFNKSFCLNYWLNSALVTAVHSYQIVCILMISRASMTAAFCMFLALCGCMLISLSVMPSPYIVVFRT